ncbi:EamA family transporter RarD [Loigolactobacillus bifermentans]|uniref:RarD protein n=1 Tax=Loigolactobacillus bifermentans DSM 20003 TaxID=1423726 RepID=A0A0R1H981_9LACO|nr:EamA family transporter RarD [Loigolactobacillus bifermentans]KRK40481.1 rarD protein [Loigolactobacillus bifermentans DSM 20003]QGG59797.1 EamA family transporter RarD [Loigolactobacillus bifermentans]
MENRRLGVSTGLASYSLWGLLGVFWETLHAVPAFDTLAYRIVWSIITIALVLTVQRDWRRVGQTLKQLVTQRKLGWIVLSSVFISLNWLIYIYMVTHQQATEASLGYYIMPLINVLVAVVVLHERLSRGRLLALGFVVIGVAVLTLQSGQLPLMTLMMAASFCFYGLIKKQVPLPATISLTLETLFVLPLAVGYLWWSPYHILQSGPQVTVLLMLSGVVTVIPLLLFAVAAKNTDFVTLSFLQYLNPTMQLLMAVFVLHEPFQMQQLLVFGLIWIGVLIFTIDNVVANRRPLKKS